MTESRSKSFDFDTPVDRRNTGSIKWDRYKGRDVIPLWVADMDFKAPPPVLEALVRHVGHGVFGYTFPPDGLQEEIIAMLAGMHGWKAEHEWLVWLPGLVTGINVACRTFGEPGDEIMTTIPAYPPFLSAPVLAGRMLSTVTHVDDGSRYIFDFSVLERTLTDRTRMFLLCNPQNPTGRVFTEDELLSLARICLDRGVAVCSDEIHCGLVLDSGARHVSLASLDEEIARHTITLLAPSKTYNLPGLGCSFAVIPDRNLRRRFRKVMEGIVPHVNALGYTAALAAYRDCEDWRLALIDYLRKNRKLVEDFVAAMPGIEMRHVEATYLAWIDCRSLGIDDTAAFFETCGVGLSDGRDFGMAGFARLNFGCPRSTLEEALSRMENGLGKLAPGDSRR